MPAIIHCPLCDRKVRVPDDLYGKKVKCPGCLNNFEANTGPAAVASNPAPSSPQLSLDEEPAAPDRSGKGPPSRVPPLSSKRASPPPRAQADRDLEPCPYCGEDIPVNAWRCRFCGEELDEEEDDRHWDRPGRLVRRDSEPHRGTMVMTLGIISLACLPFVLCCFFASVAGLGLGIPAWVLGHIDLKKIDAKTMDPRGRSSTKAGWICGMVGTLLHALVLVVHVGFLGFMLAGAAQPTPVPSVSPAPSVPQPKMLLEQAVPLSGCRLWAGDFS